MSPSLGFFPGKTPGSLRVRLRGALADLVQPAAEGLTRQTAALRQVGTSNDTGSTATYAFQNWSALALSPGMNLGVTVEPGDIYYRRESAVAWESNLVSGIANMFSRYRCCSPLRLSWHPASSTASDQAFVLAFSTDPMNARFGLGNYVTVTGSQDYDTVIPYGGDILSTAESQLFSSWIPWSHSFPVDMKTEFYTSSPGLRSGLGSHLLTTKPFEKVEPRMSCFGCLAVASTRPADTSHNTYYGTLFAEMEYEFSDFCPQAQIQTFKVTLADPAERHMLEPLRLAEFRARREEKTPTRRVEDPDYVPVTPSHSSSSTLLRVVQPPDSLPTKRGLPAGAVRTS